jgi:GDP-fucose transporter C1
MYNTILAIILMFPTIVIFGEFSDLMQNELLYDSYNWGAIIITGNYSFYCLLTKGVFGFLINIAVFLQIKHTSPLTNNISGTLKACLQTLFAMVIYKNPISPTVISTFCSLLERIWYFLGDFRLFLVLSSEIPGNEGSRRH